MIDLTIAQRVLRPIFWLALVFSLTMALLPKPPRLPVDQLGDKWQHMLAFGVLTVLGRLAWPRLNVWILLAWLALYGIAIEAMQRIPALHRDSDWRDWVADCAAIALAALFAQLLLALARFRDTN